MLTPFPCWVKELSERSEAKWRKKKDHRRGNQGIEIGQSPFHSLLGVCWLFYYGNKGSIFWAKGKVDVLN